MRLNVRNLAAECPKCGGDDFIAGSGKRFEFASETTMRCVACGAATTYVELMMQIADKAVQLSAATLEEIRRKRDKN